MYAQKQGRSQTFQNEGAARGAQGLARGPTGTQNGGSPLASVQSVISFGGERGQSFCQGGGRAPCPPSGYATSQKKYTNTHTQ